MSRKPTKKQLKDAKLHDLLALMIGHNELAKQAKTLGEKVYHRMASKLAMEEGNKLGMSWTTTQHEETLVTVGTARSGVELYPRDIELMKKAIAEYEQRK